MSILFRCRLRRNSKKIPEELFDLIKNNLGISVLQSAIDRVGESLPHIPGKKASKAYFSRFKLTLESEAEGYVQVKAELYLQPTNPWSLEKTTLATEVNPYSGHILSAWSTPQHFFIPPNRAFIKPQQHDAVLKRIKSVFNYSNPIFDEELRTILIEEIPVLQLSDQLLKEVMIELTVQLKQEIHQAGDGQSELIIQNRLHRVLAKKQFRMMLDFLKAQPVRNPSYSFIQVISLADPNKYILDIFYDVEEDIQIIVRQPVPNSKSTKSYVYIGEKGGDFFELDAVVLLNTRDGKRIQDIDNSSYSKDRLEVFFSVPGYKNVKLEIIGIQPRLIELHPITPSDSIHYYPVTLKVIRASVEGGKSLNYSY